LEPLNCKKCRSLLSRYLDKELDNKQQEEVTNHLRNCSACKKELKTIKEMDKMCSIRFFDEPSEEYWSSILPRLRRIIPYKKEESLIEKFLIIFKEKFLFNPNAIKFATAASLLVISAVVFSKVDIRSIESKIFRNNLQSAKLNEKPVNNTAEMKSDDALPAVKQVAGNVDNDSKIVPERKENVIKEPERKPESANPVLTIEENKVEKVTEKANAPVNTNLTLKTQAEDQKEKENENVTAQLPKSEIILARNDKKPVYENTQISLPKAEIISAQNANAQTQGENNLSNQNITEDEIEEPEFKLEIPLVDDTFDGYLEIKQMVEEETVLESKKDIMLQYLTQVRNPEVKMLTIADIAEFYYKLYKEKTEKDFINEANLFYKLHKNIIENYLGSYEYNKRIKLFGKIR